MCAISHLHQSTLLKGSLRTAAVKIPENTSSEVGVLGVGELQHEVTVQMFLASQSVQISGDLMTQMVEASSFGRQWQIISSTKQKR